MINAIEKEICRRILEIDRLFNQGDLYHIFEKEYSITNHYLIDKVFKELCDLGIAIYLEVEKDIWGYVITH